MKKIVIGLILSFIMSSLTSCNNPEKTDITINNYGNTFKGTVVYIEPFENKDAKKFSDNDIKEKGNKIIIECEEGTLVICSDILNLKKDSIININSFNGTLTEKYSFTDIKTEYNGFQIEETIIPQTDINIILNSVKNDKDYFKVQEIKQRFSYEREEHHTVLKYLITYEDEGNNSFEFKVPKSFYNTFISNSVHYCKYDETSDTFYIDGTKVEK